MFAGTRGRTVRFFLIAVVVTVGVTGAVAQVPDPGVMGGRYCDADYQWYRKSPFMVSDQTQSDPPSFPVSGNTFERNFENFRLENDSAGVQSYLPQRSLVRVLDPSLSQRDITNNRLYVPVEVVGMPGAEQEVAGAATPQLRNVLMSDLARAKVGDRGRIYSESLQPAGKFTYIVTADSVLARVFAFDNLNMGMAKAVQFVTRGEGQNTEYMARKCCTLDGFNNEANCEYKHLLRVFDSHMNALNTVELDVENCGFYDNVRAVDKSQARALLEILNVAKRDGASYSPLDVEFIDSMGLVKLPYNEATQEGPFNTSHYNPVPGQTDLYLNATTACAFTKVLQEWNRAHPRRSDQVQVGDGWHLKAWGDHRSHEQMEGHGGNQGTCVDIRPLSSSSRREALTYDGGAPYDREKTQAFVDLVRRAGADTVIFADRHIEGASHHRDHNDHLHFCFNPTDPTVQSTCANGL